MKILITGASGFIGKNILKTINKIDNKILASSLQEDYTCKEIRNVEWVYGNIADINLLSKKITLFNPDVVIHLAWEGIPNYSGNVSLNNLINSINFLNFISDETNCNKIIVAGSCFEYGKFKGVCKEDDQAKITSFISWAKHSLYTYLELKCIQKSIDLVWFRVFYVFGPGQRHGSLLPTIINELKMRKTPNIRTPFNRNDFIYIADVVDAFLIALNNDVESGIYNIGCGASISVFEISKIAEYILFENDDFTKELNLIPQNNYIDFWADISKSKEKLNWQPQFSIEEGIRLMIENV